VSLRETPGKRKATTSRRVTHLKSSDCMFTHCAFLAVYRVDLAIYRTDKAVLAVNGFAADGNMFIKKVRQRLEVRYVL